MGTHASGSDPHDVDARARELGLRLAAPVQHPARLNLRDVVAFENLAFISGTGPLQENSIARGRLGGALGVDEGYSAARSVGIRMLEKIYASYGSLGVVDKWLKVVGYVNCVDTFEDQPAVLNGFSDLMVSVYGAERAICARTAVGTNSLPLGIPVEVDAVIALRQG